jgi:uncharacterized membrane protein YkoI
MTLGLGCCVAWHPASAEEKVADRLSSAPATTSTVSASTGAVSEAVVVRRWMAKTRISLPAAIKIAVDKVGAGRVVEAYFKVESSRPQYVVEIATGKDDRQEVSLDAIDGKIVELGAPDPEEKAEIEIESAIADSKISIPDAIEAAAKRLPQARPFDAYGERRGATLTLSIEFLDGLDVVCVRVDPTSGGVLSVDRK